jgi:hypothetical protein
MFLGDLWGPLIFCLLLSLFTSLTASEHQSVMVFTGVFSIVWMGEAVVTFNLKLLGGTVYVLNVVDHLIAYARSFFQSVCTLGYCLFPLTVAALVNIFVHTMFVRLPVIAVMYVWTCYGTESVFS